ncbi:MAG: hypothetical protein Kow006_06430 [Gammaproteobacteria bacterium]
MRLICGLLFLLLLLPVTGGASPAGLQEITDLRKMGVETHRAQRPLLLVFTAEDCPYCEMLEEEVLLPMLRSGEYDRLAFIRSLNLDGDRVLDFEGHPVEPWEFARRYQVSVTPTMVLLDERGRLLDKPMVGVRTLDFFEAYIAESIQRANRRLAAHR